MKNIMIVDGGTLFAPVSSISEFEWNISDQFKMLFLEAWNTYYSLEQPTWIDSNGVEHENKSGNLGINQLVALQDLVEMMDKGLIDSNSLFEDAFMKAVFYNPILGIEQPKSLQNGNVHNVDVPKEIVECNNTDKCFCDNCLPF